MTNHKLAEGATGTMAGNSIKYQICWPSQIITEGYYEALWDVLSLQLECGT